MDTSRGLPAGRTMLSALQAAVGVHSARMELRWMRSAVRNSSLTLEEMVRRRITGEPLQYIIGNQPFGPLTLLTRPPVLIPRPETEHWTMKLSELLSPTSRDPLSVLDLCTGSGCIPLLLCHIWPRASVTAYGVDISPQAIQLAEDNARLCNISIDSGRTDHENVFVPAVVDIRDPAFLETLKPPFDIVTANPPYISSAEYDLLPPCVRDYEDPRALLGDPEGEQDQRGLSFYHSIARILACNGFLKPDALVVLEVGEGQADSVKDILRREGGFHKIQVWKDGWGKDRTVVAQNRVCL